MDAAVGISTLDEAEKAGQAAAEQMLAELQGTALGAAGRPNLSLVVVVSTHNYDLPALLRGVRRVTADAPLVGATSGGVVADGVFHGEQTGEPYAVGVLGLADADCRFSIGTSTGLLGAERDAGRRLARGVVDGDRAGGTHDAADPRHRLLLLLTEGLGVDHQEVVRGVHQVLGARVPVVGGVACDSFSRTGAAVFVDDQVLRDAAVGVLVSSQRPLVAGVRHGWTPAGLPSLVTAADGVFLCEIGGRDAFEVYCEQLGIPLDMEWAQLRLYARSHQLGLLQSDGSYLVRSLVGKIEGGGGLQLAGPVATGASVQLLTAQPDQLLDGAEDLGRLLRDGLDQQPVAGLLFSCIGRQVPLGAKLVEEGRRAAVPFGAPVLGMYTYGEICRTSSVLGFHNASVSGLAL